MSDTLVAAPFQNCPPRDFAQESVRAAFANALKVVRAQFPIHCPALIDGKSIDTTSKIRSENPSSTDETVAQSANADSTLAMQAITTARDAFEEWSFRSMEERADILDKWADLMEAERDNLSALMVFESGKPWREADADTIEAIDFLRYYAEEARVLGDAERLQAELPGETNDLEYHPLGVVVVIAPWNFPLAIPTGMVSAALVCGNPVIFKPAEQTPAIAYRMVQLGLEAGLPPGALSYLPGDGEKIGPTLVEHPEVDMIVFTGSRTVGTIIHQGAAAHPAKRGLKRVVAEMGGKNPLLLDADADLDVAIPDILHSAFSFGGQKCSALSRLIVHESQASAVEHRLAQAAASLKVGPAEEPLTVVGPLIEESARKRLETAQQMAVSAGRIVYKGALGPYAKKGHFVAPTIIAGVDPSSDLATKEFFGPFITMLTAKSWDDAIAIANNSDYALTAGIHSRSPKQVDYARRRLHCGNLYINRGITGAIVGRQPFGGYKFSGVGSKAGGPDYLKQFLVPRVVTENIVRQGFAPPAKATS